MARTTAGEGRRLASPILRLPSPSFFTLLATSALGASAFLYPFLLSNAPTDGVNNAHTQDAPIIFGALMLMAAVLFILELSSKGMNAKVASALAVLAVAAAVLRIPRLPGASSAFFFLIILSGYVYGPRFGFLLGVLALFISALPTGGFGPWLPFQMLVSGWLGLTSGWLGALRKPITAAPRLELAALVCFGALWGFAFGALMNLWFWPYVATGENVSWRPGMGLLTTLEHYWAFYALTSLGWDAWAAISNAALIAIAGRPVLSVLVRFRDRFQISFGS